MYDQRKEYLIEEFKEKGKKIPWKFVLDKFASPNLNFSENKIKRGAGNFIRKTAGNYFIGWANAEMQEIYSELYNEKPLTTAIYGTAYNMIEGWIIASLITEGSDHSIVDFITHGSYIEISTQNIFRIFYSKSKKKSYPPPALVTLATNIPTYVERFKENRYQVFKDLSSTVEAQGIIKPLFSSDGKDGKSSLEKLIVEEPENFKNNHLTFKGN